MSNHKADPKHLSSPPLVWVRVGKEKHPAYLWKHGETHSEVKWTSALYVEQVENTNIIWTLSSRRRQSKRGLDFELPRNTRRRGTPDRLGEYYNDDDDDDDDDDDEFPTDTSLERAAPSWEDNDDDDEEAEEENPVRETSDDEWSDSELDRKPRARESPLLESTATYCLQTQEPAYRLETQSNETVSFQAQNPEWSLETQSNETIQETVPQAISNSARTGNVTKESLYSGDSSDDEFDYKLAETQQQFCTVDDLSHDGRDVAMGRSTSEGTEPKSRVQPPQYSDQSPCRRDTLSNAPPLDSSGNEADYERATKRCIVEATEPMPRIQTPRCNNKSPPGRSGTISTAAAAAAAATPADSSNDEADSTQAAAMSLQSLPIENEAMEESLQRAEEHHEVMHLDDSSGDDIQQSSKSNALTVSTVGATDWSDDEVDCKQRDESISGSLRGPNRATDSVARPRLESHESFQTSDSVIDLVDDCDDAAPQSDEQLDLGRVSSLTEKSDLSREPQAEFSSGRPAFQKYASSAYLQNLAEICYTICHDRRWRVEPDNKTLFRWELGDDMSMLTELSRYFRPPPRLEQKRPCTCLLCVDNEQSGNEEDRHDGDENSMRSDTLPQFDAEDDDTARPFHLYCRLFYRKGPWFRIDEIYKYYAPSKPNTSAHDQEPGHSEEPVRRVSNGNASAKPDSAVTGPLIDEELLGTHKACLEQLLVDLYQLRTAGRIRSFADEEECGRTVGASLLKADERNVILSKLGGSKKKVGRQNSNTSSASNENLIWKQMSQQHSLLSLFNNTSNKRTLLPVKKYVDELLMDKLAKLVVSSCSKVDYVPANVMRTYSDIVKTYLRNTLGRIASDPSEFGTCFRLREAPMRTLQRCARLYLCATGGPGDMRGDGANGWRSLHDLATSVNPPMAKTIPPPSALTWHKVEYPGLMVRFGRMSAPFSNTFEPLPVRLERSEEQVTSIFYSPEAFRAWEWAVELRANVDYLVELHERQRFEERRRESGSSLASASGNSSVDFLDILNADGQHALVNVLFEAMGCDRFRRKTFHRHFKADMERCCSTLGNECLQVLSSIGALVLHILCVRHQTISDNELDLIKKRPWLRHLGWDGCMAYILWDIIPHFERNGLYQLAVQSLQVLLFGRIDLHQLDKPAVLETTALAPFLLSRRARGKALDRLVIDSNHLCREQRRQDSSPAEQAKKELAEFCRRMIANSVASSSISFSSIRGLARRLKQPLSQTLTGLFCVEARELGLRLANDPSHLESQSRGPKKYTDWTPMTDRTVANAISNNNDAGGRCAFVGFEDSGRNTASTASLNVEELAMEYYRTGRLPSNDSTPLKGGWHGWHDEGGHLRALFRIICSSPVLGMDWGCAYNELDTEAAESLRTIHLLPYQSAPFDLHVGYELLNGQDDRIPESAVASNGFYFRRQDRIDKFLKKLEQLSGQELSDLVFLSIHDRLVWMTSHNLKDPFIQRDLNQARSLSAIAAGCGGKQLAAAFRCLFYDYRHYSGGLPDLLLIRAIYSDDPSGSPSEFADLGDWIGESFSPEFNNQIALERGISMLSDRDDEFLGCSKVGDSGGRASRSSRRRMQTAPTNSKPFQSPTMDMLPEKLVLSHNGRPVMVECMMVEVKSSNDRLDPRQEDWLNILDRHGNAKVCKFEETRKNQKKVVASHPPTPRD